MTFLKTIFGNLCLIAPIVAWCLAQLLKFILDALNNGKFTGERLWGSGGMPSAHSATVCALTATVGITCGAGSAEFAMAVIFSIIVMFDAFGVRKETGRHARFLNQLTDERKEEGREPLEKEHYHEQVGHTLPQVIVGGVLGLVVAFVMAWIWGAL